MSGGVSAASIASYAATAAAVVSAASTVYSATKGTPKAEMVQQQLPAPPKLEQTQAAVTADTAGAMKKQNAAAYGAAGQDSTLLTGLNGVAPSASNLAKNTLLGM
jgi:hypothetical protein